MDLDFKRSQSVKRFGIKLEFSYWLLAIAFTLFTFIITLNPALVKADPYLSLQLSLCIPLYFSSIFARAKISLNPQKVLLWEEYGFIVFMLAYGMTINVIGILLTNLVSLHIGLYFWGTNILASLIYTAMEVHTHEAILMAKLPKDIYFILILLILGILPSLGLY
ncbi:MAG: hypothetical protein JWN37_523 [Candidatus Nomurabacteria bacterium]|nr:hypothetical protein [Candidatus Nomurabacteria bacterium]